jgi:hypothetical protein
MSMDHNSTYKFDCRMSLIPLAVHIPPVTFPSTAVSPPAKSRTIPTYDMHNIRFASPSNMDIYTNPKLAPVLGSAIPLSYDSQNNLFGNLFTPTTTPSRKVGTGQRKASGFRVKGKCRSSQAGKENCKEAEAVPWNCMY